MRNQSQETWRAEDGFAVGYHLFDPDTGTLIVDGARVHPGRNVAPGESMPVALDFDLPPENGSYQVLVSPMREDVCWYYEQGWPFLVVEGPEAGPASAWPRSARCGASARCGRSAVRSSIRSAPSGAIAD